MQYPGASSHNHGMWCWLGRKGGGTVHGKVFSPKACYEEAITEWYESIEEAITECRLGLYETIEEHILLPHRTLRACMVIPGLYGRRQSSQSQHGTTCWEVALLPNGDVVGLAHENNARLLHPEFHCFHTCVLTPAVPPSAQRPESIPPLKAQRDNETNRAVAPKERGNSCSYKCSRWKN